MISKYLHDTYVLSFTETLRSIREFITFVDDMDVATTYLYQSLDVNICMKILERFKVPEAFKSKDLNLSLIKL